MRSVLLAGLAMLGKFQAHLGQDFLVLLGEVIYLLAFLALHLCEIVL